MNRIIRTNDLSLVHLPGENADWHEISEFAVSFDPKSELGTTDIYDTQRMSFDEYSTLIELRTSLFLLQRWWNNRSISIDADGLSSVRRLLDLISKRISESKSRN